MKKRMLFIVAALMACCISVSAQETKGASSLTIGFSPFGTTKAKIKKDEEKYEYDYKTYWNVNAGYEKEWNNAFSVLFELSYAHASFDKYDLKGTTVMFNPAQDDDMNHVTAAAYAGMICLQGVRFQFPIYVGLGAEYLKSGKAIDTFVFDVLTKVRAKYYVTDKIAVFVGGNAKWGWGGPKYTSDSGLKSNDYKVSHNVYNLELGVAIGLN